MPQGKTKLKSKGGVVLEAYVVPDEEKELQAKVYNGGHETLHPGDALITVRGKQYALPAPVVDALFGAADEEQSSGKADKGGQQQASRSAEK